MESGEFILKTYDSLSEEKREKMCKNMALFAKTLPIEKINDKNNFWHLFVDDK